MTLQINQTPSPNFWGYNSGFEAVVCHGTASGDGDSAALNAEGWLRNPQAQASSNYVVWQSGRIDCLVDPYRGYAAWANGIVNNPDYSNPLISRWLKAGINPNLKTISIEHVAASSEMIQHQTMPPAQQQASQALILQLAQDFHIAITRPNVIGHYQIDSVNRANCPGVINLDQYVPQLQNHQTQTVQTLSVGGHILRGEMLKYWQKLFNPLLVCGLPLTDEFVDRTDGRTTQVFERAVLKFYPENVGTDWIVMGQLLGRDALPVGTSAIFKWVSEPIKTYVGRLFNPLVVLGSPLSDLITGPDGRPVQYFERAALKVFAEFAGTDWGVQGDHVGATWLAAHPSLPTPA